MACVTEKQPSRKHGVFACIAEDLSLHISILFIQHTTPTSKLNSKLKMPQSRELTNKKNVQKDRQSRGRAGSDVTNAKKGGAGAHNWGVSTTEGGAIHAVDRNDPNYDSSEEAHSE